MYPFGGRWGCENKGGAGIKLQHEYVSSLAWWCGGSLCCSTQVKLRGDLLSWVASVMYPSVGVFLYYGLEDDVLFNCKSVVYLILQLRFVKNIKIFYCVH